MNLVGVLHLRVSNEVLNEKLDDGITYPSECWLRDSELMVSEMTFNAMMGGSTNTRIKKNDATKQRHRLEYMFFLFVLIHGDT